MNYLDFEEPIKDLDNQLKECLDLGKKSDIDVTETSNKIRIKLKETIKDIYSNLSPWQKVQISRQFLYLIRESSDSLKESYSIIWELKKG